MAPSRRATSSRTRSARAEPPAASTIAAVVASRLASRTAVSSARVGIDPGRDQQRQVARLAAPAASVGDRVHHALADPELGGAPRDRRVQPLRSSALLVMIVAGRTALPGAQADHQRRVPGASAGPAPSAAAAAVAEPRRASTRLMWLPSAHRPTMPRRPGRRSRRACDIVPLLPSGRAPCAARCPLRSRSNASPIRSSGSRWRDQPVERQPAAPVQVEDHQEVPIGPRRAVERPR